MSKKKKTKKNKTKNKKKNNNNNNMAHTTRNIYILVAKEVTFTFLFQKLSRTYQILVKTTQTDQVRMVEA